MATDTEQQVAMLRIVCAACSVALDAFRATDEPVDGQLVADLGAMVERTHDEIERLSAQLGESA